MRHVLSACPQSLQMYAWQHNKVLEVVIEFFRARCETAICNSQGTHYSVSQGRWMSCEETKNPNMKLLNGARDWKVSVDLKTSLQFPIHIIQTEKRPDIVAWSDSECPPHRIDCPLGRKPWGSTRAEEKPIRDTACRLRGKGVDMPCDSYWGWLPWFSRTLSHFISFKNRNHWPQFESCLKSSSDRGAICVKLDLVESDMFSAWRIYTRNLNSREIT